MKLSHKNLIIISGLIWFTVGIYLLQLGLNLLLGAAQANASGNFPLLSTVAAWIGTHETAAILLIALALFVGYFKGRYVLGKSATKGCARIAEFPNPAPLSKIYSPKYYILLGLMMGLGMSIKFLGINDDIRGFIDVIIGSALINGAVIYFRLCQKVQSAQ